MNADEELLSAAQKARENAYAPYSRFRVGAALRGKSGRIFAGCNVENASFGAALCAERSAVGAAVAAGEREFESIAIVGGSAPTLPCGICRQVLQEFSPEIAVICRGRDGGIVRYPLKELLPHAFADFSNEQ